MHRYSQSDEDEVIATIFARIGEGGKRFVEFGCGDGRQNNTIALLHRGWSGAWFEPHKRRYLSAKERWAGYPVAIKRRVITADKVNLIIKDPIDFLSIDIDGPDCDVWEAMTARPRVVCIEAVHEPERARHIATCKGYVHFGWSASLVNAFFLRDGWA